MRTRAGMSRGWGIAFGLAMAFTLGCPLLHADPQEPMNAEAEGDEGLDVGTRLVALDSVMVSQAEIARGTTVNVTRLLHRQGRLAGVDVELADGHVARVPIATVRSSFRVLED